MAEVLEGDVVMHRDDDGRVRIAQAPPTARIGLALLAQADHFLVRVSGNRIALAGQVVYRVVGWDAHASALLLEREGPGPDGPATTHDEEPAVATWPPGAGTRGA